MLVFLLWSLSVHTAAQTTETWKWWNPAANNFPVIEGQAWPAEVAASYDRFPARAQKTLPPNVWNISRSSAGLYVKFKTNAPAIIVRYVVKGELAMSHMPATGVSGIDLYSIDPNGIWGWAPGNRSYGDTIEYRFQNLVVSKIFTGRDYEYRLYLPLYKATEWLQIGVPSTASFIPMPLSLEKPIVVYGTSIAQGACASRPGMAWTNILQQRLDRPVINLGFSGSGKLEASVIDLMAETDAKLYVLDCIPNLTAGAGITGAELERRILAAVKQLKAKQPHIPVLLAEHCISPEIGIMDAAKNKEYAEANNTLQQAYSTLKAEGVKGVYYLSNRDIGFSIYSTVDGLHPNDVGMMEYANAYEKIIRTIIHEPAGKHATTMPVVQSRDGYYDWRSRHREILILNKTDAPAVVFLGNSILHYWGGNPKAPLVRGADSWNEYLAPAGVGNFAFGWDKIENVLWRVYHDELDGFDAKQVLLMIGTNNLSDNSDHEIVDGLTRLVEAIQFRQPKAVILLSGILPRRDLENRILVLNSRIEKLAKAEKVRYINPGVALLNGRQKIDESLFSDGLHLNERGYRKLGVQLKTLLSAATFRLRY
ncbi:SGNH/GDSL hydrolase family protein [Paraflavitalea devenefica]|uniref:SGNH/GDSL hydrolase family protein n=1 Tax=Paraflavitalea devenefica TaxID=2716334 RepID=UPI001FE29947|nr:SGNH/GDSL hydrolase family protein [Paraflavitalea devenefica]